MISPGDEAVFFVRSTRREDFRRLTTCRAILHDPATGPLTAGADEETLELLRGPLFFSPAFLGKGQLVVFGSWLALSSLLALAGDGASLCVISPTPGGSIRVLFHVRRMVDWLSGPGTLTGERGVIVKGDAFSTVSPPLERSLSPCMLVFSMRRRAKPTPFGKEALKRLLAEWGPDWLKRFLSPPIAAQRDEDAMLALIIPREPVEPLYRAHLLRKSFSLRREIEAKHLSAWRPQDATRLRKIIRRTARYLPVGCTVRFLVCDAEGGSTTVLYPLALLCERSEFWLSYARMKTATPGPRGMEWDLTVEGTTEDQLQAVMELTLFGCFEKARMAEWAATGLSRQEVERVDGIVRLAGLFQVEGLLALLSLYFTQNAGEQTWRRLLEAARFMSTSTELLSRGTVADEDIPWTSLLLLDPIVPWMVWDEHVRRTPTEGTVRSDGFSLRARGMTQPER